MRRLLALVVFVALPGICGCEQFRASPAADGGDAPSTAGAAGAAAAPGGVAVIDLDRVAELIGRDVHIRQAIREREEAISRQLKAYQESLQAEYDARLREFGPAEQLTAREREQLDAFEVQLNQHFGQAQQQALQEVRRHQAQVIQQFRDQVIPVARAVARQRGLGLVIPKNEALYLTFDPAIEITDAVAAQMAAAAPPRSEGYAPSPSAPAAPPRELAQEPRTLR